MSGIIYSDCVFCNIDFCTLLFCRDASDELYRLRSTSYDMNVTFCQRTISGSDVQVICELPEQLSSKKNILCQNSKLFSFYVEFLTVFFLSSSSIKVFLTY